MPLRFSFLKSIFVDGMSVKNVSPYLTQAALKWKMHYSTAKIIARLARKSKEADHFHQLSFVSTPTMECSWKEISLPKSPATAPSSKDKEDGSEEGSSRTSEKMSSTSISRVELVCTLGWTYLNQCSSSEE